MKVKICPTHLYHRYNNNQYKRASAVSPTTNVNSAPAEPTFTSSLIYNPSTGLFETVLVETSMETNIEAMKEVPVKIESK